MFTFFHSRDSRRERETREVQNNMYFQGPNPDAFNAYREMQIKAQAMYINQLQTALLNQQNPDARFAYQQTNAAVMQRQQRMQSPIWRGMLQMGAEPPVGDLYAFPRSPARILQDSQNQRPIPQQGTRERFIRARAENARQSSGYEPYAQRMPTIPPHLYTNINVTGLSPNGPERTYPLDNMRQQRIKRNRMASATVIPVDGIGQQNGARRISAGSVSRGPREPVITGRREASETMPPVLQTLTVPVDLSDLPIRILRSQRGPASTLNRVYDAQYLTIRSAGMNENVRNEGGVYARYLFGGPGVPGTIVLSFTEPVPARYEVEIPDARGGIPRRMSVEVTGAERPVARPNRATSATRTSSSARAGEESGKTSAAVRNTETRTKTNADAGSAERLRERETKLKNVRQEIASTVEQFSGMQKQITEWSNELASVDKRTESQNAELEKIQADISNASKQMKESGEKIAGEQKIREEFEKQSDQAYVNLQQQQKKRLEGATAAERLKILTEINNSVDTLQAERAKRTASFKKTMAAYQTAQETAQKLIENLSPRLAQLQKQSAEFSSERQRILKQLESITLRRDALQQQMNTLRALLS